MRISDWSSDVCSSDLEKLRLGRYFFMDILLDGIVLFEESDYSFVEPQPLSPEKALQETREYYEDWFGTAQEFVDGAEFHLGKEHFYLAAFNYHQATERLYHCL